MCTRRNHPVRSEHCAEHCAEHCVRGITPPGRTRSSRIAFRARLRPSLRPISCPRTSSRASMRCPCVFAGSRDERDLIESSTDTRSSTFRACIRSTENNSRSRERPSNETCTCPSDHRSTARVSTFRGHRLELFSDIAAQVQNPPSTSCCAASRSSRSTPR